MRGDGDTTAQVLISHSAGMAEIATEVLQALRVMIPGVRIACSSVAGRAEGDGDSLAALKRELTSADTVIGFITGDALASADVPFQLGAAWALGKRVLLLLSPEGRAGELSLPLGHADALVLGPETLIELARSLASAAGTQAELGPASTVLLMELFPSWTGPQRDSTERAVPTLQPTRGDDTQQMWLLDQTERTQPSSPPPEALQPPPAEETTQVQPVAVAREPEPTPVLEAAAPQPEPQPEPEPAPEPAPASVLEAAPPQPEAAVAAPPEPEAPKTEPAAEASEPATELPSASVALKAGCAISERAWNREDGSGASIDDAFGSLLQKLGRDWSALSRIGDVDLWMETADNVLDTLGPRGQHVRAWYDVGYQATLLLNLARRQLEREGPDDAAEARWQGAWVMLRDAAGSVGVASGTLDELHAMLENLRGPARDYTNLGRAQERVAGLADQS